MSGPLGSSQWMYSSGGEFYPYEIGQSLRFNDDDSAYLSRTPASAGSRTTWTWSGWVKRAKVGVRQALIGTTDNNTSAGNFDTFYIENNDTLTYVDYTSAYRIYIASAAVFRDTSAWYHFVLSVDTTQATSSDRVKLYVNGEQITALSQNTYPALNLDTYINNAQAQYLGAYNNIGTGVTALHDGYMAEVNFIDGTALDPTSFGEFKSGVWIPKKYTGSYGTNGFYLSFADSAAIGDDLSGNGNDWTPSGLASTDVLLDSPTNNYCVLNPLYKNSTMILSDGNLRASAGPATYPLAGTMVFPDEGKWYAEFTVVSNDAGGFPQFGLVDLSTNFNSNIPLHATKGVAYSQNGNVYRDGVSVSTGAGTFTTNDVIGVAYDATTREVWFSKNNVWVLSGDPAAGTSPAVTANAPVSGYAFGVSAYNAANVACNFGQLGFAYTPPDGFLPLNTANLPAPAIDPAQDDVPADYFNTVLYTGTGAALSVTGVGFQPDFLWLKNRGAAGSHHLYDAQRGAALALFSDATAAENSRPNSLTSFDTDGFTVGTSSDGNTNLSANSYVAWNWKANGAGVSNTDGTITSTVSANQKAGFSIVGFDLQATGSKTVGHGLGVAPKMVIVKQRTSSGAASSVGWLVYHAGVAVDAETDYLLLNATSAAADQVTVWDDTAPTSTVFTVGSGLTTANYGTAQIAYCFAEVEGFSKFGSYTGNGSANGPFVYCGFRPAFVIFKATNAAASWIIQDNARDTYNPTTKNLYANVSNAEDTGGRAVDFLSNGFKPRFGSFDPNISGYNYVFMAFAEQPFKYANAR